MLRNNEIGEKRFSFRSLIDQCGTSVKKWSPMKSSIWWNGIYMEWHLHSNCHLHQMADGNGMQVATESRLELLFRPSMLTSHVLYEGQKRLTQRK